VEKYSDVAPHDLRSYAESRIMPNRWLETSDLAGSFGVRARERFGIIREGLQALQEGQ
jgi:hypothetical protein